MRQIKTANIKVDAFPMAAAKKDTGNISKKDFMEQLESFLAKDKKTETKSNESQEVTTDEKETLKVEEQEEDFEATLNINLVNLHHSDNQPVDVKIEASLLGEVVELPKEEVGVDLQSLVKPSEEVVEINTDSSITAEDLAFKLENLMSEDIISASDGVSNPVDESELKDFLLKLETQLSESPELEVEDVIEGLLSENESELDKVIKNIDLKDIENISQEEVEPIATKKEPNISDSQSLEIEEMQVEGIEAEIAIEQTEVATESKDSELGLENEIEAQTVELSTGETFEPVNRVDFAKEMSAPVQSVAQEDFLSSIKTLMIDETESLDGGDKITTARIQLTPEYLGKVDLQIEINGKELTAKLIVEQKETKEWIDQQVAHLKEKLLTQEITVKDFQVVVHEENLNDAFMNSEENPFFKQKEKDSQARKEQRLLKNQATDVPVQREERSYSTRSGISILV